MHLNRGQNITLNTTVMFTSFERKMVSSLLNKTVIPFDNALIQLPASQILNLSDHYVVSVHVGS